MKMIDVLHFIGKLFKQPEPEDELEGVPYYCRECECLGLCRDRNNNWKCIDGCMIRSNKQKGAF